MMSLLDQLMDRSRMDRLDLLRELQENAGMIKGDFEGSVTGHWVKLDAATGAGIVSYRQKEYATKALGLTSLRPGAEVELTHANGIYYSKF